MGNTAMKYYRGRGRTVSVVLLTGDIAEFKEPVRASTVMKRYPQHVVLHCRMASNIGMGQRRKTSVLKPNQSLHRDQNYLLTPLQTAGNDKSFLDSWASFTLSVNRKKLNSKSRRKARRVPSSRKSWIHKLLFGHPQRSYQILEDFESKPLVQDFNRPSKKSSDSFQDWRPSLECIPESPTLSRDPSCARYSRPSSFR